MIQSNPTAYTIYDDDRPVAYAPTKPAATKVVKLLEREAGAKGRKITRRTFHYSYNIGPAPSIVAAM